MAEELETKKEELQPELKCKKCGSTEFKWVDPDLYCEKCNEKLEL